MRLAYSADPGVESLLRDKRVDTHTALSSMHAHASLADSKRGHSAKPQIEDTAQPLVYGPLSEHDDQEAPVVKQQLQHAASVIGCSWSDCVAVMLRFLSFILVVAGVVTHHWVQARMTSVIAHVPLHQVSTVCSTRKELELN